MNHSPLRAFLLILFVLGCFGLSPQARAVCQEGCLTNYNTVLGEDALLNNTGVSNTAIGFEALWTNRDGSLNTAVGLEALFANTTGGWNTAIGALALETNTTGYNNTATGAYALLANRTGSENTATGFLAMSDNRTGNGNSAIGAFSLFANTFGQANTAMGSSALRYNIRGSNNTGVGESSLLNNTTGNNNIALGYYAGQNLTTGSNNIDIGNAGVAGESNRIRIGTVGTQKATFIAGISGATVPGGVGVIVGNNGKLGTVVSSERFKDDIKPMDKASEAILALKPVTFRYKQELDRAGIPQFGLVAEDVEKVNPDLVARDDQGKPYTVRYEAINAMLLNEFLKEHRTVKELKKEIAALTATLKEQAAQIQKVNVQLEASKFATGRIRRGGPPPQMALNNQ